MELTAAAAECVGRECLIQRNEDKDGVQEHVLSEIAEEEEEEEEEAEAQEHERELEQEQQG